MQLEAFPRLWGGGIGSSLILCATFTLIGGAIASRQPGNAFGWAVLAIGALSGVALSTLTIATPPVLAWMGYWSWWLPLGLLPVALLLFPTGRLPSRRWRPVLALAVAGLVVPAVCVAVASLIVPDPMGLLGPPATGTAYDWLTAAWVGALIAGLALLSAVISLFVRLRGATHTERRQLECFAAGGVLLFVGLALGRPRRGGSVAARRRRGAARRGRRDPVARPVRPRPRGQPLPGLRGPDRLPGRLLRRDRVARRPLGRPGPAGQRRPGRRRRDRGPRAGPAAAAPAARRRPGPVRRAERSLRRRDGAGPRGLGRRSRDASRRRRGRDRAAAWPCRTRPSRSPAPRGRRSAPRSAGARDDLVAVPLVHRGEAVGRLLVAPRTIGGALGEEDRRLLDRPGGPGRADRPRRRALRRPAARARGARRRPRGGAPAAAPRPARRPRADARRHGHAARRRVATSLRRDPPAVEPVLSALRAGAQRRDRRHPPARRRPASAGARRAGPGRAPCAHARERSPPTGRSCPCRSRRRPSCRRCPPPSRSPRCGSSTRRMANVVRHADARALPRAADRQRRAGRRGRGRRPRPARRPPAPASAWAPCASAPPRWAATCAHRVAGRTAAPA